MAALDSHMTSISNMIKAAPHLECVRVLLPLATLMERAQSRDPSGAQGRSLALVSWTCRHGL